MLATLGSLYGFVSRFIFVTVVLRMISFGYDYHWADQDSRFDQKVFVSLWLSFSTFLFLVFSYGIT